MNSTDSNGSHVRIVTHWRRFSTGLWRVPEGDIAAAYSASILPKVLVFVHEGRLYTNGGCAFSKWLHAEASCYPLTATDAYHGAESVPYSYEGHEVAYRGKVFRLGAKTIFVASDPTVDEWRQSARVLYADGGYFAAHCTYTEFIGNRFDPASENGRAARFQELAECGARAMPRTQAEMLHLLAQQTGLSNLSLTGKIAHFELGYIPESAKELKAAAGFLITNHARKHIITLPRALRKRNVYEEVARFLDIPGGQEIVQESYAQLRKFNCWNISIVQQYARFKQSRIRSAVFGNSRQFFIMRQNDRADLDDMGKDIALPEVTQHAIMNYPLPDHQSGQKYSPFTYFHTDSGRNLCGTVHNISSREMLYCSSSSGEHFDQRARELRQSPNIVEGIIAHANK